jgi:hypothetical protein
MSSSDGLKRKLQGERIECPRGTGQYMIPRCKQEQLITEYAIKHELGLQGVIMELEKARSIREHSMQLFGILAYLKRSTEIQTFVDGGITDKQLPLKRDIHDWRDYCLKGQGGETFTLLESWDDRQCEKFCKAQRLMTAPVFKLHHHYEFDDNTVLPFIDFPAAEDEAKDYRGGGYSEIHIRCIHPSQHEFWDSSQDGVSHKKSHMSISHANYGVDSQSSCYQKDH